MPKVSIIVPVYNTERYLPECLESLINQTLRDIEIICINDGSTDDSLEILKEFEQKDKRILLINKKNEGYGRTINLGLNLAKGEYIGIVESDDYVDRNMFEILYNNAITNKNIHIIKGSFKKIYDLNHIQEIDFQKLGLIKRKKEILNTHNIKLLTFESSIWSAIYKNSFIKNSKIKMIETKGAAYQDAIWKFMIYTKTKKILLINKCLYNYRVATINSSTASNKNPLIMFENYSFLKKYLEENNIFKNYKEAFYTHLLLDSVFHAKRLYTNKRNIYLFLENYGNYIRKNIKELKKIKNKLSNPEVNLVFDKAIEFSTLYHKLKQIIKIPIKIFFKLTKKLDFFFEKIINLYFETKNNNQLNYSANFLKYPSYFISYPLIKTNFFKNKQKNKRKKILYFMPFTTKSGFTSYNEAIIKLLAKDYQIHLVTYNRFLQPTPNYIDLHFHIYPNNFNVDNPLIAKENKNFNFKIDDWCKEDLLESIKILIKKFKYEIVIVNYVFYSKIFKLFNNNAKKILITVDKYSNLNLLKIKNKINDLWYSTSPEEEKKGLLRSDLIISLNKKETLYFKKLLKNKNKKIITLIPILEKNKVEKKWNNFKKNKLKIGFFASNYIQNYYSIKKFLNELKKSNLKNNIKIIIAGTGSDIIRNNLNLNYFKQIKIEFMGALENIVDFYKKIDLVINPDYLNIGLKIKNLEAISLEIPLLCSKESNNAILSKFSYHNINKIKDFFFYIKKIINNQNFYEEIKNASIYLKDKLNKDYKRKIKEIKNFINF